MIDQSRYAYLALLSVAALVLGCGSDTGELSDCRDDDVGCQPGFVCSLIGGSNYGCVPENADAQPDADVPADAHNDPMATSDAGDLPDDPPAVEPGIEVESAQLAIPYDEPTDPRTVAAVLGVRRVISTADNTIEMWIGPSFNVPESSWTEAYHIYSPDDPNYPLDALVEPTAVDVSSRPAEVPAQPDARGRPFDEHRIRLTVPSSMVLGARYFVRAVGGQRVEIDPEVHHRAPWQGMPLTAGQNAGQFVHGEDEDTGPVTRALIESIMGMREITVVGPHHVRIELGASADQSALDDPANFTISSLDDPNYAEGAPPIAVGRRSYPEVFAPGYGYPFPRKLNRHEVYLQLPSPLVETSNYIFTVSDATTVGRTSLELTYSDDTTRNHHLKVNQIGYRPDAVVKMALLGAWMGTLGTLIYGDGDHTCQVIDAGNGEVVFEGQLVRRHSPDATDEGAYQMNFTSEDLFACDFGALQAPGIYYVKVAGMGRSYDFEIADDVYLHPFRVAMRGIFYQRSGQSIDASNSVYRRVASHLDPVSIPYMEDRAIRGGHYDAGDYNPRLHYDVVHILLLLYELFPQKFADGQLHLPERGNGVPDVVDEALWGLQAILALQDEDGGVGFDDATGHFLESTRDPNFVELAERDPTRQFTYAKHPRGALILAALAASASRVNDDLGRAAQAESLLSAARLSYSWAKANGAAAHVDDYAWAAAELSRTTREQVYLDDLEASGYAVMGTYDDGHIGRLRAAYTLASDSGDGANLEVKSRMQQVVAQVVGLLGRYFDSYAYPHYQHPYAPVSWGTAAYPHTIDGPVVMWAISGEETFRRQMTASADFSLGLNPLNYSWTTGLGDRPVYGPAHLFGWATFIGVIPPGLQVEGPNRDNDYISRFMNENVPSPAETPQYYNYYDVRYSIGLNEGLVKNQAMTAFAYGSLLPDLP